MSNICVGFTSIGTIVTRQSILIIDVTWAQKGTEGKAKTIMGVERALEWTKGES